MSMRFYLEQLANDQRKHGNVGLKHFIISYDIFSHIMIYKEAFAKYSQVEMLLSALPTNLTGKAVIPVEFGPTDSSTFIYDMLRKHVLEQCVTAAAQAQLDSVG